MHDELAEYQELANDWLQNLFPICRSLAGSGVRKTFDYLLQDIDFDVHGFASGSEVFDWVVPSEWEVEEAYIEAIDGHKIVDFEDNNLHLVSHSSPFEGVLTFDQLKPHLHTLEALPDAVPYRTTYYQDAWGFCLSHNSLKQLDTTSDYRVVVKTKLTPGFLNIGEAVVGANSDDEFLIHTYCCHPSMANDNLSGVILWGLLLKALSSKKLSKKYRFVIAPETIGALCFLKLREDIASKFTAGLILTTVGGSAPVSLKSSFLSDTKLDQYARHLLTQQNKQLVEHPFSVFGSDERQFSSPAFRIPMISLAKSQYHHYDEYHTSEDNLDFVKIDAIMESFELHMKLIQMLESDSYFCAKVRHGEPMLSKRDLYPKLGGKILPKTGNDETRWVEQVLWMMHFGDGSLTLFEVAQRTNTCFFDILDMAISLEKLDLIQLSKTPIRL